MLDAGIIAVWFLDSSVLALDFRHRSRFAVADVGTKDVVIQLFRSLVIVLGSCPHQAPAFGISAAYLSLLLVLERVRLAVLLWNTTPIDTAFDYLQTATHCRVISNRIF